MSAYCVQCGFERRVTGKDEIHALGLCAPHRAHYREAVARFSDVEIGDEHVEWLVPDFMKRIRHISRHAHFKAFPFQDGGQSLPDSWFIIDEQNTFRTVLALLFFRHKKSESSALLHGHRLSGYEDARRR